MWNNKQASRFWLFSQKWLGTFCKNTTLLWGSRWEQTVPIYLFLEAFRINFVYCPRQTDCQEKKNRFISTGKTSIAVVTLRRQSLRRWSIDCFLDHGKNLTSVVRRNQNQQTKSRTLDVQYLFGLFQRDAGLGIGRGMRCACTSSTSPTSGLLACSVFLFESFGQRLADYLRADDNYLHNILGHGSNVVPRKCGLSLSQRTKIS